MIDIRLTALGVAVILRVAGEDEEQVAEVLAAAWSRCLDLPVLPHARHLEPVVVAVDRTTPGAGARGGPRPVLDLMPALTRDITARAIGVCGGALSVLPAAALVSPISGRASVLVAPEGTDTTAVCRALGVRWGYLAGETAGVTADGMVVPFPGPLPVRVPGRAVTVAVSPDALGLVTADAPVAIERLVLLDRVPALPGPARLVPVARRDVPARFGDHVLAGRELAGWSRAAEAGELRYAASSAVEAALAPVSGGD